jgi:hypothetical protein
MKSFIKETARAIYFFSPGHCLVYCIGHVPGERKKKGSSSENTKGYKYQQPDWNQLSGLP